MDQKSRDDLWEELMSDFFRDKEAQHCAHVVEYYEMQAATRHVWALEENFIYASIVYRRRADMYRWWSEDRLR